MKQQQIIKMGGRDAVYDARRLGCAKAKDVFFGQVISFASGRAHSTAFSRLPLPGDASMDVLRAPFSRKKSSIGIVWRGRPVMHLSRHVCTASVSSPPPPRPVPRG